MYAKGQGVPSNRVVAYALGKLSQAGDPVKGLESTPQNDPLGQTLSSKEIEAAQALTREITIPGNLLKALDNFLGDLMGLDK